MTEINEHAYICDQCGATVHTMRIPRGWLEMTGYCGALSHCCTKPVCQKLSRDFAAEHGEIVFESKPLREQQRKDGAT